MRRDPRSALLAAAACLAGLVLTGLLALASPVAHSRDAATLHGFTRLNEGSIGELASGIAHLCDPEPYGLFGLGIVLVALARRRWRVAAALPFVLFLAPLTSETLKPLLATPRVAEWLGASQITAAWPSGHSTAAMTLALCAVLAAPARLRPAVAVLGALFAITVAYAILVLAWHFPSDVLGGYLVAGLWTSLASAAVLALDRRRGRPAPVRGPVRGVVPAAALLAGAGALAALLVALAGVHRVADYAREHATFVAGAAAIGVLALLLAGTMARALSERAEPRQSR